MDTLVNDGRPFRSVDAPELGLSSATLRHLRRTRLLRPVLRGVQVDARVPDSRVLRARALELVRPPRAVFYGDTVAFLLGVETARPRDRFDLRPRCIVPHGTTRARRSGVSCKEGYLPRPDITSVDGVPVTTPVRTTVDLLRTAYRPHALAAADAMAHAGFVTVDQLVDHVGQLKGYPGIIQARSLAPLVEPATESKGESWQRLRLVDAGFPRPESQIRVLTRGGREIARLDMGYRDVLVGLEYDGVFDHTTQEDVEHDARRRTDVESLAGWRVVVARSEDIWGDDPTFERRVGELLGLEPLSRSW